MPEVKPAASPLPRRLLAEASAPACWSPSSSGPGSPPQQLSPDDIGLQLLENSTATVFGLAVLILMFGPVSGAHFNPVVSAADWLLGRRTGSRPDRRRGRSPTPPRRSSARLAGAVLANVMFDLPAVADLQHGPGQRSGTGSGRSWPPPVWCC